MQPMIQHTAAHWNRLLGQNTIVRPFPFDKTSELSIRNRGAGVEEDLSADDFS